MLSIFDYTCLFQPKSPISHSLCLSLFMVLFSEHFIEAPGRFYPTVDDNTYLVYDPESAPHPVRTLCKFLKKSRPTVDTSVNYNEPSSKFYHTFSLEHATIQSVRYCPKSKSESTLCTGSTHDKWVSGIF